MPDTYANQVKAERFKGSDTPAPAHVFLEPDARFDKKTGRGFPMDGEGGPMVLIAVSVSPAVDMMLSQEDWLARMGWRCPCGMAGWACKDCINEGEVIAE